MAKPHRQALLFPEPETAKKKEEKPAEPKGIQRTLKMVEGSLMPPKKLTAGVKEYREIKRKGQKKIQMMDRVMRAIMAGKAETHVLGRGKREFTTWHVHGEGFDFVIKKGRSPKRPSDTLLENRHFDQALSDSQRHISVHNELEKIIPEFVPARVISFISLTSAKPTHAANRVHPFEAEEFELRVDKETGKPELVPTKHSFAPVDTVIAELGPILGVIETTEKAGFGLDAHKSNWGIDKKRGRLVYLDTFHKLKPSTPIDKFSTFLLSLRRGYPKKEWERMVQRGFELVRGKYGEAGVAELRDKLRVVKLREKKREKAAAPPQTEKG